MYLAQHPDSYVTIAEIAGAFQISSNHLMKVVQHLAAEGEIVTMRGQHGGLRLARPPENISLGHVVRRSEPDMDLLASHEITDAHAVQRVNTIANIIDSARDAFLAVLDAHTVADLAADGTAAAALLPHRAETSAADNSPSESHHGTEGYLAAG